MQELDNNQQQTIEFDVFQHATNAANAVMPQPQFGLILPELRAQLPEQINAYPLVPDGLEGDAHQMPALIVFNECSPEALDWLNAQMKRPDSFVCAAFHTDATLDELIYIYNQRQVSVDDNDNQRWMRLHDPRVFVQLVRIASVEQQKELFGCIDAWWLNFDGKWTCLQVERQEKKELSSTAYWEAIDRIGIVNRCLFALNHTTYDKIQYLSQSLDTFLTEAIPTIEEITEESAHNDDIVAWVKTAANSIRRFHLHPSVHKVLMEASPQQRNKEGPPTTVADVLARITQADFQALKEWKKNA